MKTNHLTRLNTILTLRAKAKQASEKTFLHTSAANNAKLILTLLQCHYDGKRYLSTAEIAEAMNQCQPNVHKYLTGLWLGCIIKRKSLPATGKGGRRANGWSAKP